MIGHGLALHLVLRFSPDSEAMGFLLQITMSCPRAFETGCWCWCRVPVLVLGAGGRCWWRCCELAVHVWRQVAGAGAGCRVPVLVL